jgi:hypothetical protein
MMANVFCDAVHAKSLVLCLALNIGLPSIILGFRRGSWAVGRGLFSLDGNRSMEVPCIFYR